MDLMLASSGPLFSLAAIVVIGIMAQWIAWRLRLPSILLLLTFGLLCGPVTRLIHPDDIFGDLLLPIVSLSVAIILYEGGLTLKLSELQKVGGVVRNLVSVGAAATWLVTFLAAHLVLGLSYALSALLGAVLIVTGPTVIAPLLRHIRPIGPVGPALRWEGIAIDPIGALLTVLIYEAIALNDPSAATAHAAFAVAKTILVGGGLGVVSAGAFVLLVARHQIADHLQNAFSVMLVVGTFAASNAVQEEAGLLTVTVMGFALANQKRIDVEHIIEFKENLQVLLISVLFIVLGARLDPTQLMDVIVPGLIFVAVLVLVGRPLCVWISTLRSRLNRRERLFLAAMAPRGIVAAAIASVLALKLEDANMPGADKLVPVTFITIIATVALYGLLSPWVSRRLGVAEANPQGVLFVGAHDWSRLLAETLQREGYRVLLVDSNRDSIREARMAGLPTYGGSILAEHTLDSLELGGIGRMLAATPNDWVNVLSVQRFERIFGRAECYQLPPRTDEKRKHGHRYLQGRWAFGSEATLADLRRRLANGWIIKATGLTEEFDYESFREQYGDKALPLFVINAQKSLRIISADADKKPAPGEKLISFVDGTVQSTDNI